LANERSSSSELTIVLADNAQFNIFVSFARIVSARTISGGHVVATTMENVF
jgi:hypothetical protein